MKDGIVRTIYLYLFALVGLFILTFGAVNLIGATLDRYILPEEFSETQVRPVPDGEQQDTPSIEEQRRQFEIRQNNEFKREVTGALASMAIGLPLWLYHWSIIKRDRREEEDNNDKDK